MIRLYIFWTSAAFFIALSTAGCATTAGVEDDQPPSTSTERLEEIYKARRDSARMQFTQADVDFMTGMIAHHAQALVMSELAPQNNASPEIQTLAARIINAQKDEIETMQRWLRDRGQPIPEIHIDGTNLMVHGVGEHHMHMPGMLTDAQLQELAAVRGEAFDRLFLEYMIQHHSGAVAMVEHLFGTDSAAQGDVTFRLASDIQVDQITEIERMKSMLETRMRTIDG